jgi:hypothetical protein
MPLMALPDDLSDVYTKNLCYLQYNQIFQDENLALKRDSLTRIVSQLKPQTNCLFRNGFRHFYASVIWRYKFVKVYSEEAEG